MDAAGFHPPALAADGPCVRDRGAATTIARSETGASSTARTSSSGRSARTRPSWRRCRRGFSCASATSSSTRRSSGSGDTVRAFVVPADAVVHGLRVALDVQRGPWSVLTWWNPARRQGWRPWGRPGLDYTPGASDFQRYGVTAARVLGARARRASRALEGSWVDGHDLDRFSRYTFDSFENRLRGYPSASLRFDRGAILRVGRARGRRRAACGSMASSITPRCATPGSGGAVQSYPGTRRRSRGAAAEANPAGGRVRLRHQGAEHGWVTGHARGEDYGFQDLLSAGTSCILWTHSVLAGSGAVSCARRARAGASMTAWWRRWQAAWLTMLPARTDDGITGGQGGCRACRSCGG